MSENKKTNKNDKDDFDPYDFFKLVGPEDNKDKNKKRRGKEPKRFPFFGVLLMIIAGLFIADMFFMGKANSTIEFSKFKTLVEDGTIVEVEIGDSYKCSG